MPPIYSYGGRHHNKFLRTGKVYQYLEYWACVVGWFLGALGA
jgi:hypothetical protein